MSDFSGLYDIRDGKENDKNFVLATFLRGLYYGDSWFSLIPKNIFMDNYKKIAHHMIYSPTNTLKVACLKDDPDVILGYCLLTKDQSTIHWVFVKAAWRNQGIAKSLLPVQPTTVSHLTALGKKLMPKYETATFNPFKLD